MSTDTPAAPPGDDRRVTGIDQAALAALAEHDDRVAVVAASPEFAALRSALRRFVLPMTAAFLVWYGLYVLLSAYARDFMTTKVAGNVNIALVFGLLQFVSTFVIAWQYARYADRKLDPLAERLRERLTAEVTATPSGGEVLR